MSAKLLVDPANPADIAVKNRRKFASAGTDDIDVFTGGARDREDFLDTAIRVLAAVVFSSCQPFKLHGGEQRVVVVQRGVGIMYTGAYCENELGHPADTQVRCSTV
jgi:hypothetical protein